MRVLGRIAGRLIGTSRGSFLAPIVVHLFHTSFDISSSIVSISRSSSADRRGCHQYRINLSCDWPYPEQSRESRWPRKTRTPSTRLFYPSEHDQLSLLVSFDSLIMPLGESPPYGPLSIAQTTTQSSAADTRRRWRFHRHQVSPTGVPVSRNTPGCSY